MIATANPGLTKFRRRPGAAALFALVALALMFGSVQRATSETLIEALGHAYLVNPRLQAQRARLRATDERAAQAISNWRPSVSIRANAGRAWLSQQNRISQTTNPSGAFIHMSQVIFRGGRNFAQYRRAKSSIFAERASLAATEQSVLLDVTSAYMDVLRDRAVLRFRIRNEAVLRRQLADTLARFQAGTVRTTDVAQARARLARARSERTAAEGGLLLSRARYQKVVGRFPAKLKPPRLRIRIPKNVREAVALARRINPQVVVARYNEAVARADVRDVAGEMLPSVRLEARAGREFDVYGRRTVTDGASVSVQVAIPLYQSGAVASRLRAAKQVVLQRRSELIEAQRTAAETAAQAWAQLQTAQARIASLRSEVRANIIAFRGVRAEAQVGLRTVLDVLNAQQELLNAQVNLISAKRDHTVAHFAVLSAIGGLTAKTLDLPVARYDPRKNYRRVKLKPWGLGPPLRD